MCGGRRAVGRVEAVRNYRDVSVLTYIIYLAPHKKVPAPEGRAGMGGSGLQVFAVRLLLADLFNWDSAAHHLPVLTWRGALGCESVLDAGWQDVPGTTELGPRETVQFFKQTVTGPAGGQVEAVPVVNQVLTALEKKANPASRKRFLSKVGAASAFQAPFKKCPRQTFVPLADLVSAYNVLQ